MRADELGDLATRAISLFEAGDSAGLAGLAKGRADPWQLADRLCLRGASDAALALAKAVGGPDVEALPAYVETRRGRPADADVRAAWHEADEVHSASAASAAVDALLRVRDRGDAYEKAWTSFRRADFLRRLRRADEAQAAYLDAARAASRAGWLVLAARAADGASAIASDRSDLDGIAEASKLTREIAVRRGDRLHAAAGLSALASVAAQRGAYGAALERFRQAIREVDTLGDAGYGAWIRGNLGFLYQIQGAYREALATYEEGATLAKKAGDAQEERRLRTLEAGVLVDIGDYTRAVDAVEEALGKFPDAPPLPPTQRAELEGTRGSAQLGLGHLGEATASYERALALYRKQHSEAGVLEATQNLAWVLMLPANPRRDLARAETLLRDVIDAARKARDPWVEGHALQNLARDLEYETRSEEAARPIEASLELGETLASPRLLADGEHERARIALAAGRAKAALEASRKAIGHLQEMVVGLGQAQGAEARARHAEVFDLAGRAALEAGDLAALYEVIERGRAQTLLESLEGDASLQKVLLPSDVGARLDAARAAVVQASLAHDRAVRGGVLADIRGARDRLGKARSALEEVVGEAERAGRPGTDLVLPEPASVERVQARLAPGQALVLTTWLSDQVIALVLEPGTLRLVRLGKPAPVRAACEALDLEAGAASERLARLRQLVGAPLGLSADVREVLVSPDGPLYRVPFATVFPNRTVAYVPSATLFCLLQSRRPAAHGHGVLAFGDPASPGRMAPLPAAADEARDVGDEVEVGAAATEAALGHALEADRRWRALHLACHCVVDAHAPLQSALLLAPGDGEDGRLTLLDVLGLRVRADLVVLSACESAGGRYYGGEGLVGLTRGFMSAGAPSVLVSLWKVDDAATHALMKAFYARWNPKEGKGIPAAEALREAQEAVRARTAWHDPRFWAAWQLWGLPDA